MTRSHLSPHLTALTVDPEIPVNEAIEDFGYLITDELDAWQANNTDARCEGAVIVDFLTAPHHAHLVAAVLTAAGWRPPAAGCPRRPNLNRSHGQHC